MKTLVSLIGTALVSSVLLTAAAPLSADSLSANQLAQLRREAASLKRQTDPEKRTATVVKLMKLGTPALEVLTKILDEELDEIITNSEIKSPPTDWLSQVEKARKQLKKLRDDDELSKKMIEKEGDPAMDALTLLYANQKRRLESQRARMSLLVRQFATLISFYKQIEGTEAGKALEASDRLSLVEGTKEELDEDETRKIAILEENKTLRSGLPADIVAAITELNQARMMLGLDPLTIDPKLCIAAAGHSSDMVAHDFFEHESVVPGKRKFTDRAKLEGTTAAAENIYIGSINPSDALKGWYYSPPHHQNMFSEKHNRIGLGRKENRWTLMFGR
jgi:uncharacterized protein YkwD